MKRTLIILLSFVFFVSCHRDPEPTIIDHEFIEVKAEAQYTTCDISCQNEGVVRSENVHARLLYSLEENMESVETLPMEESDSCLTCHISGLAEGTLYYYTFEAFTNVETYRAKDIYHFTTNVSSGVTVTTGEVTDVTQTTAKGNGNVTVNEGIIVTERGICWDTEHNPTTQGAHSANGYGAGEFSVELDELIPGVKYYVRAYAVSASGTEYGAEVSFTTHAFIPITVTTGRVTDITRTTAKCNGMVATGEGVTVNERGICWNTEHNPTIQNMHLGSGLGAGEFVVQMANLNSGTQYYVRAYAVCGSDVEYGEEVSFTTNSENLPEVITGQMTNVTAISAIGHGQVLTEGASPVMERGVCWSTDHDPLISDNHSTAGSGVGNFSVTISGLTPGSSYYLRAYAKNSSGTTYGSEVSFTALEGLPEVETISITDINDICAIGHGMVSGQGGSSISDRGMCWSTEHNPTLENSHASGGQGLGEYDVSMSNLSHTTTYYVRAYAVNNQGISYGVEMSFTTAVAIPVVTTRQATNVSHYSATISGEVMDDGGSTVTKRGICWAKGNTTPTYSDSHISNGNGIGTFEVNIPDLLPGTTYTARAYAQNSIAFAYGNLITFTTLATPPMVITGELSYIAETSAKCSGEVTYDGGAAVSERGICWSIQHNPTTNDAHNSSGSGVGVFDARIMGLTNNTTYYVRAYAINDVGTSYGDEISFTTSTPQAPQGGLSGLFTISDSGEIVFISEGNLQYQASSHTWRFAQNQWDLAGDDNTHISLYYSGWIDLFGWGTSGYNHGAAHYQPWSISTSYADYYAYGDMYYNLYDQTGLADWGHNAISNGGNQEAQWRTLTSAEWSYVFDTRNTTSGIRYAKATVNGITGVILVPDNWNASTYSLNNCNQSNANFSSNNISASVWTNTFEPVGCVFLPTAGYRMGTTVLSIGSEGFYWASSCYSNSTSSCLIIKDYSQYVSSASRHVGCSVRLVCPAN